LQIKHKCDGRIGYQRTFSVLRPFDSASVYASDFASDYAKAPTGKKASPDRQDRLADQHYLGSIVLRRLRNDGVIIYERRFCASGRTGFVRLISEG
jgi:hypothetical protein